MVRRVFLKKAAMAAAGAAIAGPAALASRTDAPAKKCKVLLINGSPRPDGNNLAWLLEKIHAGGPSAPERETAPAMMNFIR